MRIKDPILGYIEISKDVAFNIVDTAEFQRLREIRQTNYNTLYPGSLHNRFTHSLGVYYLGKKMADNFFADLKNRFQNEIKKYNLDDEIIEKMKFTISMACLLHDVGHAPFSHSCEQYYLEYLEDDTENLLNHFDEIPENATKLETSADANFGPNNKSSRSIAVLYNRLYKDVMNAVNSAPDCETAHEMLLNFKTDYSKIIASTNDNIFKPHEGVSVIIGIELLRKSKTFKNKIDYELFARSIIGCLYEKEKNSFIKGIKNSLINMLNSDIIDADKLDYLLRDMKMTGYMSPSIDMGRLLDGYCLVKNNDEYTYGFKKDILSALTNFLIISENEKKWIQNHPSILYEGLLFADCIEKLKNVYGENIFKIETLSFDGTNLNDENDKIRLLCDCDILYLLKQIKSDDDCIKEFFSRKDRKKAVWKNVQEFNLIFKKFDPKLKTEIVNLFTEKNLNKDTITLNYIDDAVIEKLNARIKECEDANNKYSKSSVKAKQKLFWCNRFKKYCEDNSIEFKIVVIRRNEFSSPFNKLEKKNPIIVFSSIDMQDKINDIDTQYLKNYIQDSRINKTSYFYLYMHKNDDPKFNKKTIDFFIETAKLFKDKFNI